MKNRITHLEMPILINMKKEVTNSNSAGSSPYAHLIKKNSPLAKQLQQISLFSNYFEHNWIMPHVETEAKEIIICTCAEKYILLSTHVKEVVVVFFIHTVSPSSSKVWYNKHGSTVLG